MRLEQHPQASLGTLRAAFEETGTPAWIMRVIKDQRLDLAEGFRLDLALGGDRYSGHRHATVGSLLAGEVDLIDSDWLSIGLLRQDGYHVSGFHPYGRIMGGLVVDTARFPGGSAGPGRRPRFSQGPIGPSAQARDAETPMAEAHAPPTEPDACAIHPTAAFSSHLKALAGRTIAVVSRFDKTWLLLRAYAREIDLADPAGTVDLVETGSKRETLRLLQEGEVDGAMLFWHTATVAAMSERYRLAFDGLNAVEALTGATLPTTFFVASQDRLRDRPDLFQAFARAFDRAVEAMRAHEPLWRHGTGDAALDGLAKPLRAAWLRRVGLPWPDRLAWRLADCTEILKARLGGDAIGLDELPDGTFALDFLPEAEVAA